MSAETETQYNPQYGVRRTIFSDEYDFLTKIESVCVQEDGAAFCSTYMEGSYRKGLCHIFDTICIPICYGT